MGDLADFIHHARYPLAKAIAWAGLCVDLHHAPETLSRTDRRLCLAELRRYGVMLRRLITRIALSIKLEPLASRMGRNWFREETALPKPRGYVFRLTPSALGLLAGALFVQPRAECADWPDTG